MEYRDASRRDVLKTFAAAGAGALLATQGMRAQGTSGGNPRAIDVHQHYQDTSGANARWNVPKVLDLMDKNGIETTIISRPGGESEEGGEKARAFCRRNNEFAAKVVSDHPK